MRILWLMMVLGWAVLPAYAQKAKQDFVVTTAGDTLRGEIMLLGKNQQTLRLYQPNATAIEFTPAQVRSYGDEKGAFGVSKPLGKGAAPSFVTLLVEGYTSLYEGYTAQGDKRLFIQPTDSTYAVELPPTALQITLLRLLPGCPELRLEYSETLLKYRLNQSGMTRLVTDYNRCRQPQQRNRISTTPNGMQVAFGLKAGINTTRFYFSSNRSRTSQGEVGYQAGFFLAFIGKGRFSAQLEPTYLAMRGSEGPEQVANGYAYYQTFRRTTIQYSQVQLPVLVRYRFGHGPLRPFLNAGPSYGVNFNNQSIRKDEYQTQTGQTAPATTEQELPLPKTASIGLAAGGGVLIRYATLPLLSVEVRYDRMHYGDSNGFTSRSSTWRLDVGVAF